MTARLQVRLFLPEVIVKEFYINSFLLVTFLFPKMQWNATNQEV